MEFEWNYSTDGVDWEELAALYRAAPLGDKKPAALEEVFTQSRFKCFVRENGRLVGAGRALADGADCAYIADVAVRPERQGQGLGTQIVAYLVAQARGHKKIILYAVPGREPFYRRLGFRRMQTAMAIFEDQQQAMARGFIAQDYPLRKRGKETPCALEGGPTLVLPLPDGYAAGAGKECRAGDQKAKI